MVCYVLQEKCNIMQDFCMKVNYAVVCYALSNIYKSLLRPSDQISLVVHSLLLGQIQMLQVAFKFTAGPLHKAFHIQLSSNPASSSTYSLSLHSLHFHSMNILSNKSLLD